MADKPLHLSIFHLERTDDPSYGEYLDFVVIAKTEMAACLLAGYAAGGNSSVWADADKTKVTHLGYANEGLEPQIVLAQKLGE